MKKSINGSVYNTKTAKRVCEQLLTESSPTKGAYVKQLKQLFKTKSSKYFFYIESSFSTYIDINSNDLNPKYELKTVKEQKIVPISYELALQFASEVVTLDSKEKENILSVFPILSNGASEETKKVQKKIYLSEKTNWYLEMMLIESEETNSSFIEKLIFNQYRKLYETGDMQEDPYNEMN